MKYKKKVDIERKNSKQMIAIGGIAYYPGGYSAVGMTTIGTSIPPARAMNCRPISGVTPPPTSNKLPFSGPTWAGC